MNLMTSLIYFRKIIAEDEEHAEYERECNRRAYWNKFLIPIIGSWLCSNHAELDKFLGTKDSKGYFKVAAFFGQRYPIERNMALLMKSNTGAIWPSEEDRHTLTSSMLVYIDGMAIKRQKNRTKFNKSFQFNRKVIS
ncbi:MAG: hypothetical protein LKF31_03345 [Muribaculaceae bacterium]|jgi:hypothetical protein|nr:hypothetical protein [Muribaculaceae bacterium]